jgi:anti-sigma factor RsiW
VKCSHWHRTIALYVGRELGPRRGRRVEQHLEGCAACRDLAEKLAADGSYLKNLDVLASENLDLGSVRHEVLAELDNRRPSPQGLVFVRRRVVASALVMVVIIAVAIVLSDRGRRIPPVAENAVGPARNLEAPIATHEIAPETPNRPDPDVPADSGATAGREAPHRIARSEEMDGFSIASTRSAPVEPMLIKILTDDPEVVIYWIVDSKGDEENA